MSYTNPILIAGEREREGDEKKGMNKNGTWSYTLDCGKCACNLASIGIVWNFGWILQYNHMRTNARMLCGRVFGVRSRIFPQFTPFFRSCSLFVLQLQFPPRKSNHRLPLCIPFARAQRKGKIYEIKCRLCTWKSVSLECSRLCNCKTAITVPIWFCSLPNRSEETIYWDSLSLKPFSERYWLTFSWKFIFVSSMRNANSCTSSIRKFNRAIKLWGEIKKSREIKWAVK